MELAKRKGGQFLFRLLCTLSQYIVYSTNFQNIPHLHIKKHYFIHFLRVFKIFETLQCILNHILFIFCLKPFKEIHLPYWWLCNFFPPKVIIYVIHMCNSHMRALRDICWKYINIEITLYINLWYCERRHNFQQIFTFPLYPPKSARFPGVNLFHSRTMTLTNSGSWYLSTKDVQAFL